MTEILTVRNLCKNYPAFELHDVSFSIRASSIMGLIGRNGAGKTTTIKSILRLVRPDGGSVEFLGQPVDDDAAALRREAGYVSGDLCYYPRKRLSQLTAVTRSFYSAWDSARYEALLRRFSLDDSKRVCELSAGMKVKYQLACALSHGAKLLILDEPTSGLDPVSRDDLLDLLRSLCEQDGVSILFSTHITSDLDACADDVTYLQNGTVAHLPDSPHRGKSSQVLKQRLPRRFEALCADFGCTGANLKRSIPAICPAPRAAAKSWRICRPSWCIWNGRWRRYDAS